MNYYHHRGRQIDDCRTPSDKATPNTKCPPAAEIETRAVVSARRVAKRQYDRLLGNQARYQTNTG